MADFLKIIVDKKPDKVVEPRTNITSIREENNVSNYLFDYDNLDPVAMPSAQVYHEEGIVNDPTQTYIKVESSFAQSIGTSAGTFELTITSNGRVDQLDKTIPITIGSNTFDLHIDFMSRPVTKYFEKQTPTWNSPVIITKQDILDHCEDFDGDTIVNWALDCGNDPNFVYNGAQYIGGTMIPIDTIDALGFSYVPINNPLGYTVQYKHLVQDSTGLITKL